MQTYSHFLLTWALERPLCQRLGDSSLPPVRRSALLLGSVAPDGLLIGISIVCGLCDLGNDRLGSEGSLLHTLFSEWFFHNPWVIAAQNLLHSPLILAILIAMALLLWRKTQRKGIWLFWFSSAAMLHTLIDIPLHHDDGPLLFFPLEWTIRFRSPISYWDPGHFGREFFLFEHLLVLILIGILLFQKFSKRGKPSGDMPKQSTPE